MGNKNTWYRKKPAEFKLMPGTYRISISDASVTPKQIQEIKDINIASGETVEKTVTFGSAGMLRIRSLKEDQPFDAKVSVYSQSSNEYMGNKNTWYRKKPAEFKLMPGTYYIKVYDQKSKETKEIRDIEIISSEMVEKVTVF